MSALIAVPAPTLAAACPDLARIATAQQAGEQQHVGVLVVRGDDGHLVTAYPSAWVADGQIETITLHQWMHKKVA